MISTKIPERLLTEMRKQQNREVAEVVLAVKKIADRCPEEWEILMRYLDAATDRPLPPNSTLQQFADRNARRSFFLELRAIPQREV